MHLVYDHVKLVSGQMGYGEKVMPMCVETWINSNAAKEIVKPHLHPNAELACVYYALADENTDTARSREIARAVAEGGIPGLGQATAGTTAGMGRAIEGLGFQSQDFGSEQAQQYMSPYLQNVLDVQKSKLNT